MISSLLEGVLLLALSTLTAAISPPNIELGYVTLRGRVNDNDRSWEYLGEDQSTQSYYHSVDPLQGLLPEPDLNY